MLGQINRNMSLNARLLLVSGLFTAPIVILLSMFTQSELKQLDFSQTEVEGLKYISAVFAAKNDPARATALLADVRTRYDAKFGVSGKTDAFLRAKDADERADAAEAVIGAVADISNLTLDPDLDSFYAMDASVFAFPEVEHHTRTTAAAARRNDHEALIIESSKLEDIFERVTDSLGKSIKGDASGHVHDGVSEKLATLQQTMQDYLHAARIMAERNETVPLDEVGALKAMNATWAATNAELRYLLEKRVGGLQRDLAISLVVTLAFLASAIAIMATFSLGLSRRIQQIVAAMEALQKNDLRVAIPCTEDRNETGKIANSLISFKRSLTERATLQAESLVIHQQTEEKLKAMEATHQAASEELRLVVREVKEGLGNLHRGDLSSRVEVYFPENYKTIRMDLNDTSRRLAEMILDISRSAFSMHSSADEIASAASALSRRTEQQAANLEQTAAALDQITAAVQQSARGAGETQAKAFAAREETVSSRAILQNTIDAMSRIENSSRQIAQIIGVIDEIAFQTNLLALNAGVEAARAGDAGRGFAVVASEVRALAQRSSDAAKDIKQLITNSATEVEGGVALVGKTAQALERIDVSVGEINTLVASIASSTKEQAVGIAEVNKAVNEMDKMTQHNAAMVEQSTAACGSLATEADNLSKLVGRFKVDADANLTLNEKSPHSGPGKRSRRVA